MTADTEWYCLQQKNVTKSHSPDAVGHPERDREGTFMDLDIHSLEKLEQTLQETTGQSGVAELDVALGTTSAAGLACCSPAGLAGMVSPVGLATMSPAGLACCSPAGLACCSPAGLAGL